MTSIVVMNAKGGVGKSTLTMALAETLTYHKNKSVLLIDADGSFYVNSRELTNNKSATLRAALERSMGDKKLPIVIQSDAASPVQSLVTAMDVVGQLGLPQVSVATTRPIE